MRVTLNSRLAEIASEVRERAADLVETTALDIEVGIKSSMTEGKSGRTYSRGKGKTHQASAPGEAPAIDGRNLVKSYRTEKDGDLKRIVGSDDEKAPILEFGGGRIAARPAAVPASENAREGFERGLKELVK